MKMNEKLLETLKVYRKKLQSGGMLTLQDVDLLTKLAGGGPKPVAKKEPAKAEEPKAADAADTEPGKKLKK